MFQVLWRYTGVPPADAPKNVKLMKWLPQNDLLGMFTTQNGYSNEITCNNCGCCAPQPIPKLKSSSLTEVATASTRLSAMLYPC